MDYVRTKQIAEKSFRAEDGLYKLLPNDDRDAFPGGFGKTVSNHNGILFLAYYLFLLREHDLLDAANIERTSWIIKTLEVQPGLYNRNPKGDLPEALDNYAAIASLSAVFGFKYAEDIVIYGLKTGYTYDNLNPGSFNIRRWRQGADVAHYKLCAGFLPTPYEWLWLLGGIVFTAYQDNTHTSEKLLTWIRIKSIDQVQFWQSKGVMFGLYNLSKTIFISKLKEKTEGKGIEAIFKAYFKSENPIWSLSEGVEW